MSRRRNLSMATMAATALLVTSCSSEDPTSDDDASSPSEAASESPTPESSDEPTPSDSPSSDPDVARSFEVSSEELEALTEFYSQELTWEDCASGMHCTEVTVPLNYDEPDGDTIQIAVVAESLDSEAPFLLTNPGGPGESGRAMVTDYLSNVISTELTDEFNVVGFDPRGVDESAGVDCMDDAEYDAYRESTEEGSLEDAMEASEQIGDQCSQRTGDLLGHVDTFSAARDMDIMRQVLGEDQLNYVGFSYGTKLGIAYADQFPHQVGRFVLDAMMDVSLSPEELSLTQTEGFETAMEGFAIWCITQEQCVGETEEEVITVVEDLFAQVAAEPVLIGDRTLNISTLVSGFITPMYSPEGWDYLLGAIIAAVEVQDYNAFLAWADQQAGRDEDASYDWISTWGFNAVMCLDYGWSDNVDDIEEQLAAEAEAAPTFGPYMGYMGVLCSGWPYEPVVEPWEPSDQLPEMLFVGTTGDPATPLQWAENMNQMVPNSALLVYEGEGHIAYQPGNTCVTEIVDEYLLTGELFEGQNTC